MTTRIGVYAGSFDPPTNGHLWMIRQGAALFDRLIVAIGENSEKNPMFSVEERLEMLRAATSDLPNVEIASFSKKYLVNYARELGAQYILRGIRNPTDFLYEQSMRHINADISAHTIQTVALLPPRELAEISSSSVKSLIGPEGWQEVVAGLVPDGVAKILRERK